MRVGAATSSGGVFGLLGTLCFFIAFGTDYWLVASDDCGPYTWPTKRTLSEDANGTEVGRTHVCTHCVFTHTHTHTHTHAGDGNNRSATSNSTNA